MTPGSHDHAGRRARLRSRLVDGNLDALLVTHAPNVRYLTGFHGSNGQAIITASDRDALVTDARYADRAGREAPGIDVVIARDAARATVDRITPSASRVGLEAEHVSWLQAENWRSLSSQAGVELVPTSGEVEALRAVKDPVELALLRTAASITVAALTSILTELRTGLTEHEIALMLERRFVDMGADGVAFPSIVASGPNGAVPHHEPGDRVLVTGDLVTMDCGAVVGGYHADCTRTVAMGAPDDALRDVYALVESAQLAGRRAARAGASGHDIDAACRTMIEEAGFGKQFVHGAGHGVGLEIHEAPAVARDAAGSLPAGTVLTVEPGIYLPGLGGVRIEDTVLLTADSPCDVLTDLDRDLLIL